MIIGFLLCVLPLVHFLSLRKSVFSFSFRNANFSGLLIIKEVYLSVVLGVILFETLGLNAFHTFFMTKSSLTTASLFILYSLITLFLFMGFFSKILFKKYLLLKHYHSSDYRYQRSSLIPTLIVLILLLLFVFYLFGVKHAFMHSLLFGDSLINVRLSNRYSGVPTVFISYYNFLVILLSIVAGYYRNNISKISSFLLVIFLLLCSSFFGGKAPIINTFVIYALSNISHKRRVFISSSFLVKSVTMIAALFIILYIVVKIQFPDTNIDSFIQFLLQRVGVGQIHGVYEQFALKLRDLTYIYHTIPFANFFFDYNIYNKDLMMKIWGANLQSYEETGVMNSLFIGEAFAIGGYWLVIFSPVIVAFNYCFLTASLIFVFNKMFSISWLDSKKIASLVIVSFVAFTGDITGLLFFKSFIMMMIFMISVFFTDRFLRFMLGISKNATNQAEFGKMVQLTDY